MLELIFFFIFFFTTADKVSGRQKTAESKLSDVNLMRHSVFDDKRLQRLSSVGECARALGLKNSISRCCTYTHRHTHTETLQHTRYTSSPKTWLFVIATLTSPSLTKLFLINSMCLTFIFIEVAQTPSAHQSNIHI